MSICYNSKHCDIQIFPFAYNVHIVQKIGRDQARSIDPQKEMRGEICDVAPLARQNKEITFSRISPRAK